MKKTLVLMLAVLLIFGCTSNNEAAHTNETTNASASNSTIASTTNVTIAENSSLDSAQDQSASVNGSNYDFSKVYSDDGKIVVYFFYSANCNACKSIGPYVEGIGKKYENQTEWRGFNIDIKSDKEIYYQFYRKMSLNQSRAGVPIMLINNTILWGRYEINDSLEQVINGSIRN